VLGHTPSRQYRLIDEVVVDRRGGRDVVAYERHENLGKGIAAKMTLVTLVSKSSESSGATVDLNMVYVVEEVGLLVSARKQDPHFLQETDGLAFGDGVRENS
jgi:hypothetical protein